MIATEGGPFHDRGRDEALFAALREGLGPNVELHELDLDVNDPAFADAMADRLHELIQEAAMTRARGARAAARAGRRRAGRSSAPAPAPASRPSAPRPAAST